MENNPQAFPTEVKYHDRTVYDMGMTLRDYFAGQALNGFVSHNDLKKNVSTELLARESYKIADKMLREREIRG